VRPAWPVRLAAGHHDTLAATAIRAGFPAVQSAWATGSWLNSTRTTGSSCTTSSKTPGNDRAWRRPNMGEPPRCASDFTPGVRRWGQPCRRRIPTIGPLPLRN